MFIRLALFSALLLVVPVALAQVHPTRPPRPGVRGQNLTMVLRFDLKCTETDHGKACSDHAGSQRLETIENVTTGGVQTRVFELLGSTAIWSLERSKVTSGTFFESGNITFGSFFSRNHTLRYSTFGPSCHTYDSNPKTGYPATTFDACVAQLTQGEGEFLDTVGVMSWTCRHVEAGPLCFVAVRAGTSVDHKLEVDSDIMGALEKAVMLADEKQHKRQARDLAEAAPKAAPEEGTM